MAQRLVRRVCPHCATEHMPDEHEAVWLDQARPGWHAAGFRQGAGCDRCGHTGYRGRIGVYELLEMHGDLLVALRNQDIDGFAAAAAADETFEPIASTALAAGPGRDRPVWPRSFVSAGDNELLSSMPNFAYTARDNQGAAIKGELEAGTEQLVAEQLQRNGVTPIRITPSPRSVAKQP